MLRCFTKPESLSEPTESFRGWWRRIRTRARRSAGLSAVLAGNGGRVARTSSWARFSAIADTWRGLSAERGCFQTGSSLWVQHVPSALLTVNVQSRPLSARRVSRKVPVCTSKDVAHTVPVLWGWWEKSGQNPGRRQWSQRVRDRETGEALWPLRGPGVKVERSS